MGQPLVTVVTPSYNQGRFIRATIESVLGQDYPKIEYIIMDGGSTDQTAAVAGEYASRLRWVSEKDRGQAHAINKGFQMARGEIVAWLNSDDILLPGAVARAVREWEGLQRAGALYGEGYLMDEEGRFTGRFPHTQPFNLWKLVYLSDYILQQSTFFRLAAVKEVGWLDETLHFALDWDLLIRLGKRFGLRYVPEYFGALREYPQAKSFSGGEKRIEEIRSLLERHTGLKRAPGFWNYGLETWQRSWRERLETRSPRLLRGPAAHLSLLGNHVIFAGVAIILRRGQGLYADGWVSDRLKWMVPEGCGAVTIRGRVPDHPGLRGQILSVKIGGRIQGNWPVGPGDFEIRFPVERSGAGPFEFELRASRSVRPRFRAEPGRRKLAFLLESVDDGGK